MDDDILSQGEDREPRPWSPWTWLAGSRLAAGRWRAGSRLAGRWPRRLAVIGAAIALAIGGAVYLSRPGPRAPVAAARPAAPSPAPAVAGDGDLPPEPDGIAGLTEPWTSSLRLPATGARPAWYSPASGRSEPIGGLPAVGSGYQFTRAGDGWAVQPNPAARTACGDCAVPALPVWYLGDGARSAVPVGQANAVAPAATPGALWLTSFPPRAPAGAAAGMAREISLTGATVGTPVRLPPGYEVARGTARGLLLAPAAGPAAMAPGQLWDPAAAGAARALPPVLAATATEVAWAAGCAPLCRVVIDNLTTGRQATVTLPKGTSAASAAFSPGGDYLALQVNSTSAGDNGALAVRLEVAPAATGRLTAVPGTFASSDALVGFGWPGGGNSLVAEFTFATKTQLAAWSPGNAWLDVAVVRPDVSDLALVVG